MIRSLLLVSALAGGIWQVGQGGLIQVKALMGQLLLERAFASANVHDPVQQPWPGAISHPVARLHVPDRGIRRLVLDGAESPVLAWGPGMEIGPNGHRLIAAHRDTHFRFLEHVEPGETMSVEWVDGSIENWRVVERQVVDSRTTAIDMALEADQLTLVTCYPFTATTSGGPLRLVLTLNPEP
jgi:sortase A